MESGKPSTEKSENDVLTETNASENEEKPNTTLTNRSSTSKSLGVHVEAGFDAVAKSISKLAEARSVPAGSGDTSEVMQTLTTMQSEQSNMAAQQNHLLESMLTALKSIAEKLSK